MQTLREVIHAYQDAGKAVGHFNFSDSNQLKAIAVAAQETNLPVIAGLSEGERGYFPLKHARALVDAYQQGGVAIYLNADHTYSTAKATDAVDAGVDSIVIDGAKMRTAENIAMVKEVIAYARARRDVVIEGELGYIGMGSELRTEVPAGVTLDNLTTAQDAANFVAESSVDCLAPAVGNVHGMLTTAAEPRLHPERVKEIAAATGVPLVLHGASGNTPEDIAACIKAGIAVVHINTEFRLLYRNALRDTLAANPDELTPYKYLAPVEDKLTAFLAAKMRLFAGQ